LDLLSNDNYKQILRPSLENVHMAERQQQINWVAEYYLRNTLSCITKQEVDSLKEYRQKFHHWIQSTIDNTVSVESVPEQIIDRVRTMSAAGNLTCKIGELLPGILRGDVDALAPMIEDDLLGRYYQDIDGLRVSYDQASVCINQIAHQSPQLNILSRLALQLEVLHSRS
jgi:hypothetical protein